MYADQSRYEGNWVDDMMVGIAAPETKTPHRLFSLRILGDDCAQLFARLFLTRHQRRRDKAGIST
jgi:hypothetical protein